jgi:hypothetical protein
MARQDEYLAELQTAIEGKHQCKPVHRETVFVHEKTDGNKTVWKGYVEIFDLRGHKEAHLCYAWRHVEGNGVKIFAILGNHVIHSAQRAIQAAIFVDAQPPNYKFAKDLEILDRRIEGT